MASVEFKIIKKLPDNGAVDRLCLTHLIIITINKKKNPEFFLGERPKFKAPVTCSFDSKSIPHLKRL